MTLKILKILYDKAGEKISGEDISSALGISRVAVKKHIDKLNASGFKITATKKSGYKLENFEDLYNYETIALYLLENNNDIYLEFYYEIDSTNLRAKQLFNKKSSGLIVAASQSQGRGRHMRSFLSQDGGVYMSYFCKPKIAVPACEALKLILVAAVAVNRIIKKYLPDSNIKWANDIYYDKKKVCGILCEMLCESSQAEYVVFGIGINANNLFKNTELEQIASSIFEFTEKKVNRAKLCAEVLTELINVIDVFYNGGFKDILYEYKENCLSLNREVKVILNNESYFGYATDIDDDGFLLVKNEKGEINRVLYGDISVKF